MPEQGETAPDFTLPRTGGGEITLSALRPKKVVLYFYPKDDTPGCTNEALAFSEHLASFEAAGALVIGISKDSLARHETFVEKHGLSVTLASDAAADVCESYGVWGERRMYGKTFMGIERTTFLIDKEGRIARVWRKVKVADHAEEVLEAVRAL